jgi:hypothetical protein
MPVLNHFSLLQDSHNQAFPPMKESAERAAETACRLRGGIYNGGR